MKLFCEINVLAVYSINTFFFCSAKHDEDKSDIHDFGAILLELILGRTIKSKNDVDALRDLVIMAILFCPLYHLQISFPCSSNFYL